LDRPSFTAKGPPIAWHYDPKSPNSDTSDFPAVIDGVESLGLRLDSAKADTSVILIDHIDRPHAN
jgi:uncharacterized protein (TIGR03435 family)